MSSILFISFEVSLGISRYLIHVLMPYFRSGSRKAVDVFDSLSSSRLVVAYSGLDTYCGSKNMAPEKDFKVELPDAIRHSTQHINLCLTPHQTASWTAPFWVSTTKATKTGPKINLTVSERRASFPKYDP